MKGSEEFLPETPETAKPDDLQSRLESWGDEARVATGGRLGIAVKAFATGKSYHYRSDTIVDSASSAKWLWAAAALQNQSVTNLDASAKASFRQSHNEHAGRLIDFAGGIDGINRFLSSLGISQNEWSLCEWDYGKQRRASVCGTRNTRGNYMTARAGLIFLDHVYNKSLPISEAKQNALNQWAQLSPKGGNGGWSVNSLPDSVKQGLQHKSGWIPKPYGDNTLNDLVIIPTEGSSIAIAITMEAGNQSVQEQRLAWLTCKVFHHISNREWSCQ